MNDAPTLDAISNVAVNEDPGEQTVNLTGISAGPNEGTQGLTFTAVSSDPTVVPNPTVEYTSPSSTGTLKFTPVANVFGTATITVTVADNGGTVNGGVNDSRPHVHDHGQRGQRRPDAGRPCQPLDRPGRRPSRRSTCRASRPGPNEPTQFINIIPASDNPGLIPTPTITYTSPNATGTLKFTPAAGQHGTATITVTLTDDGGTSNGGVNTFVRTFTVSVNGPNEPPTLDAIGIVTVNEDAPEQTVNLTGISAGPANESGQTVTVAAVSDNTALVPNPTVQYTSGSTGTLKFTPAANTSGTATITVTVTDDGGTANGGVDTFIRTFTITVDPVNDAPTLDAISNVRSTRTPAEQTVNLSGITAGPAEELGRP